MDVVDWARLRRGEAIAAPAAADEEERCQEVDHLGICHEI